MVLFTRYLLFCFIPISIIHRVNFQKSSFWPLVNISANKRTRSISRPFVLIGKESIFHLVSYRPPSYYASEPAKNSRNHHDSPDQQWNSSLKKSEIPFQKIRIGLCLAAKRNFSRSRAAQTHSRTIIRLSGTLHQK